MIWRRGQRVRNRRHPELGNGYVLRMTGPDQVAVMLDTDVDNEILWAVIDIVQPCEHVRHCCARHGHHVNPHSHCVLR